MNFVFAIFVKYKVNMDKPERKYRGVLLIVGYINCLSQRFRKQFILIYNEREFDETTHPSVVESVAALFLTQNPKSQMTVLKYDQEMPQPHTVHQPRHHEVESKNTYSHMAVGNAIKVTLVK